MSWGSVTVCMQPMRLDAMIQSLANYVSPIFGRHGVSLRHRRVHGCPIYINNSRQVQINPNVRRTAYSLVVLARYVGCRRVVFVPEWRHSVSCRRHVADFFQSCRRHKKMSCRLECLNDTTFDDMSGNSRHVGLLFEFKHKNSMVG